MDAPEWRQLARIGWWEELMNWYAIHTKPRQEATAESALKRSHVETFYPKLRRKKVIRRRAQWTVRPLFPGYFFANFDYATSHRLVRYATGIANIVSFGEKAAVVDEVIIEAIRAHSEEDIVTVPLPQLRRGDLIEIREGPFRGLEGIFEQELNDAERVVILLTIIASTARVEVAREQVEKV